MRRQLSSDVPASPWWASDRISAEKSTATSTRMGGSQMPPRPIRACDNGTHDEWTHEAPTPPAGLPTHSGGSGLRARPRRCKEGHRRARSIGLPGPLRGPSGSRNLVRAAIHPQRSYRADRQLPRCMDDNYTGAGRRPGRVARWRAEASDNYTGASPSEA